MGLTRRVLLGLLVSLVSLCMVAGSSGDSNPAFWQCLQACQATGCTNVGGMLQQRCSLLCSNSRSAAPRAPLALRLWHWDCAADCRYLCMWHREQSKRPALSLEQHATAAASASTPSPGAMPEKYFGKWPFVRLLGMQEPASVAFSLLNLATQLHCLRLLLRLLSRPGATSRTPLGTCVGGLATAMSSTSKPSITPPGPRKDQAAAQSCRKLWVVYYLLSVWAWLCSAVFHGRDTRCTERLDYYAAGTLLAFTTYLTLVRTLAIAPSRLRATIASVIGTYYLWHVYHMQFTLFDYGRHVRVCIAAGLVQAALWLWWVFCRAPVWHQGRRWLLSFVILLHLSMLFEVLDFPPLARALDAHACWHLCTAPLAFVWYKFVRADCLYGSSKGRLSRKQAL